MKNPLCRRALAIPIAVSAIVVVATLLFALARYQASRVKATGDQVNSQSALEASQAGLHLALAELKCDPEWATHRVELDSASGAPRWAEPLPRTLRSSGDPTGTGVFTVDDSKHGTVSGAVGTGIFQGRFRVRAGKLPLLDDDRTRSIDESNRYWRIEAIGMKKDPTRSQDRYTVVDVLVERADFTEYVMYDGDDIVLGMGSYHDQDNTNLFANGSLFGKNLIHLGNIAQGGTRQAFVNVGSVKSDGPIFAWNDFPISFQEPPGLTVILGPGNDSRAGEAMETAGGRILDGAHRKPSSPPSLDREYYRIRARNGGLDVSDLPLREDRVSLYPEPPKIHINFGRGGYTNEGNRASSAILPDDAKALARDYPPGFNGLIYSERPLAIWGAPDRDITIFCTEDVYICGDFNCRSTWRRTAEGGLDWVGHHQNYKPRFQPPNGPAVEGSRFFEYRDLDREIYTLPGEPHQRINDGTEERKSCAILSLGRIWYDMRHPSRYLENELRPYVKFKIAQAISSDAEAFEYVRVNGHPQPIIEASLRLRNTLGTGLQDLFDIRRKVSDDMARTRLYLTPQSYNKVSQAFVDALVTRAISESDRGKITIEKLEGTPMNPGLVDVVMAALIEDEDRYAEYPGTTDRPPPLGIWNAPQGLYDLVYDERASLGPRAYGRYSDWGGDPARAEFSEDELFMPQMTINAMCFSSAARNDPGRSVDPTDMARRFDDLGNGLIGVHFLSTQAYLRGDTENITTPIIQRFLGSEVRLATVKNRSPALSGGYYWPPIRRRIYDSALPFHPPPFIPSQLEVISFKQRGATLADFNRF